MPVNSAQELHDLIHTLSQQFQHTHQSTCRDLHTTANNHIQHVLDEGGQWITAEIRTLNDEWQTHLQALRDAESWFAQHSGHLGKIAEDAGRLATEFFA